VTKARPTDVDLSVGKRIRERRLLMGLSQHQFSELIGVTYQQVHKYEHGINSVTAGRLYEFARELNVPIEYFFEGLEKGSAEPRPRQRRLLDLMRIIVEIANEEFREAVRQLVRILAGR